MRIGFALFGAVALAGCGSGSNDTVSNIPEDTVVQNAIADLDAAGVSDVLIEKGLPVASLVTVTEETDDNNMIGRPGQYISKVYFVDERYRGKGMNPDEQNTIETFATEADATKRREYIETVTSEIPIFNQYIIQSGTTVLRLNKVLKPSEAKAYEDALK